MITLNTEKELVQIESWQDVLDRPDYETNLDPESFKLEAIIGSYVLPYEVPCGLSTCHQPHKSGYLVSTNGKKVTNIGNVCGKNNFQVEFQTLRNKFNKDIRIKSQKESLTAFKRQIPDFESRVFFLREDERGADWIHRNVTKLQSPDKGIPEKVRNELYRMNRSDNGALNIQRLATHEERELEKIKNEGNKYFRLPNPYYIEEKIGFIEGIAALSDRFDLRKILIQDIQRGLDRIAEMDIENSSEHQLTVESKWAGEIEQKYEAAEKAITIGRKLLTHKNMAQFETILELASDITKFRAFLKLLPD